MFNSNSKVSNANTSRITTGEPVGFGHEMDNAPVMPASPNWSEKMENYDWNKCEDTSAKRR